MGKNNHVQTAFDMSDNRQKQRKQQESYRINLKLKGEYKDYLSDVSWQNRVSITQYINNLIGEDQKQRRGR